MHCEIKKVELRDVTMLRKVRIDTFRETYEADYQPQLFNQYLEEEMSVEKLTEEIQNPNSIFYFVEYQGHIAGYFKMNIEDAQTEPFSSEFVELQRLYLFKQYQGLKLGQFAFEQAIQIAKTLDKKRLWLGVWSENTSAIAFYKKQGLTKVGEHAFKVGEQVDVDWMMELRL